ncbi:MAG TPA: hypothetical protein DDW89_04710 [Gammaproteobacteria bacterium]|nr:hypothetical protein [Gammaproteobacteria bacterium]
MNIRSRRIAHEASESTGAWLDTLDPTAVICCAAGLPDRARIALEAAGRDYSDEAACRAHLAEAQRLAPDHPAVLIGFYRFHFYGGRLRESLAVGMRCLAWAAAMVGLAADWRSVQAGDARFGDYAAALPRFYLFCLKGCGYLHLRLGEPEAGRPMLEKLGQLDPDDRLGGRVLLQVLDRQGREDDD